MWDMVAVQWHPECLRKDEARALFDWLTEAASLRMTRIDVRLLTDSVEVTAMRHQAAAAS